MNRPEIFIQNEHSLLFRWKYDVLEDVQQSILSVKKQLEVAFQKYILEVVIGYGELAVYLKPSVDTKEIAAKLSELEFSESNFERKKSVRKITLPVCYEAEFAPDLAQISQEKKLSVAEIIRLHTAPVYSVSFIGFLPGFPYLDGLSEKLATPRKKTPRPLVLTGSVGIGGSQTGIYSQESPGGWNIIGRTPVDLFCVLNNPPSLLCAGDKVKFQSISKAAFHQIVEKVKKGDDVLKIETSYD